MITYGSYLDNKENINDNAAWVVGLDTAVALIAGFAIFPAVFALGFDPAVGGGLAFITLPAVFAAMPGGTIFGAVFFLLLTVAALTSAISLLEVVVAYYIDEKGWSRRKASFIIGGVIFLLGVPASLSNGRWADFTIIGYNFFDFLDFLQESILLPLGGLLTAVFSGYVWSAKKTRDFANTNKSAIKLGTWFDLLIMYVLPVAISIVMVTGLISKLEERVPNIKPITYGSFVVIIAVTIWAVIDGRRKQTANTTNQ